MKKYEVIVEDENAVLLTDLLQSLPYVRGVNQIGTIDAYTLASEKALSEDWLAEEDDELQRMYNK
ncbi:MAG: hypothetical protein WKG06_05235 [Segetibacter sp.]